MLLLILSLSSCAENNNSLSEDEITEVEKDSWYINTNNIIVDYVEDAIIVRKSNVPLYGLMNNSGEYVIPLEYDDMHYLNKSGHVDGDDDLYLWAKYEDTEYILDIKGNVIFESENKLSSVNNTINSNEAPLFKEVGDSSYNYYSESGKLIGSIPKSAYLTPGQGYKDHVYDSSFDVISEDCYVIHSYDYDNSYDSANISWDTYDNYYLYIYNFNGEKINEIMGYKDSLDGGLGFLYENEYIIPLSTEPFDDNTIVFYINSKGEITKKESMSKTDFYKDFYSKYYGPSSEYNFYESNGTYKYEDSDGNPLYAKIYYKSIGREYLENSSGLILTNENDDVCIFNGSGRLCLGFGSMRYTAISENHKHTLKMQMSTTISVDKVFIGKSTLAFLNDEHELHIMKYEDIK